MPHRSFVPIEKPQCPHRVSSDRKGLSHVSVQWHLIIILTLNVLSLQKSESRRVCVTWCFISQLCAAVSSQADSQGNILRNPLVLSIYKRVRNISMDLLSAHKHVWQTGKVMDYFTHLLQLTHFQVNFCFYSNIQIGALNKKLMCSVTLLTGFSVI